MFEVMAKAANRSDTTNLAAQLADKTTRAVATSSHDAIGIRTVNALAPYIQQLQAAVDELSRRLDKLEGK